MGAHRALHLALVLWAVGRARVDVEAYGGGIAAVALVEPAPGPGAVHDRGLGVVHPQHRRDAGDALERAVVGRQPTQAVLGRHPHHRTEARVREHQVEGVQGLRLAAHDHARELGPVDLGLGSGRGLEPAPGPLARWRVAVGHEALHRAQAALIAMLGGQPGVQGCQVGAVVVGHPVADGLGHRFSPTRLVGAPVAGVGRLPGQVVAHGAFAQIELAGNRPLGQPLGCQGLDGHADLQIGDRHACSRPRRKPARLRGRPGGA